jgi:hypothetical protein
MLSPVLLQHVHSSNLRSENTTCVHNMELSDMGIFLRATYILWYVSCLLIMQDELCDTILELAVAKSAFQMLLVSMFNITINV